MRILHPVLLTLCSLAAISLLPAGVPSKDGAGGGDDELDVFLLAGQSNMAGRAPVEPFDQLIWPTLFSLDSTNQWVPAKEPLHFDKPSLVGVGPGLTFGRIVAEAQPSRRVGLVPAAVGGSSITAWAAGAQHPQTKSHPYDDAVRRAQFAMKAGRLRAILWIQGESDATAALAPVYYDQLVELIARFRRDLHNPKLPFIIGQRPALLGGRNNAWRETIDTAQRRAAQELPQVWYVGAPSLVALPDGLHLDAPSAREIGRRLAECYLTKAAD